MSGGPTPQVINDLASAFYSFGPFFLAIFVQLWMVLQAQKWYRDCCTRNPPALAREMVRYENYFIGTIFLSVALFGLATFAWWHFNVKTDYHYYVEVDSLGPNQSIAAPEYFSQDVQYTAENGAYIHNKKFVVVDDQPFKKGQTFALFYTEIPPSVAGSPVTGVAAGATVDQLFVSYNGNAIGKFRLVKKDGRPRLIPSDQISADLSPPARLALLNASKAR